MRSHRLVLCVPTFCLALASAQASTILDENFNELATGLGVTSVGAFQTIDGTNVDIVGPSNGYGALCAAPESGNCVDMDGTGGNPQGILQTVNSITLIPGVDYLLSFDLIGSGRGVTTSTSVSFGTYSQTFSLTSGDVTDGIVTNQLVTVPTTTVTNLLFTSNTPGDVGALLDNVLITTSTGIAAGVPEPPVIFLMISAMLAFGALSMRRKRFAAR
jgi:hypothetical protein